MTGHILAHQRQCSLLQVLRGLDHGVLYADVRDMTLGGDTLRAAELRRLHRQLRFIWQLAGDHAAELAGDVSQSVASQVQAQLPCFQATAVHDWLFSVLS